MTYVQHSHCYLWHDSSTYDDTGWRRPTRCLKLQIIFGKRATNYRALLRKITYKDKASYAFSPPCNTLYWYSSRSSAVAVRDVIFFPPLYVCHDAFTCVTWCELYQYNVLPSERRGSRCAWRNWFFFPLYVCHDAFTCVTWFLFICHIHVWHDSSSHDQRHELVIEKRLRIFQTTPLFCAGLFFRIHTRYSGDLHRGLAPKEARHMSKETSKCEMNRK